MAGIGNYSSRGFKMGKPSLLKMVEELAIKKATEKGIGNIQDGKKKQEEIGNEIEGIGEAVSKPDPYL